MRPVLSLLAGLILGAAATFAVRHVHHPATPPNPAAASPSDPLATRYSPPATSLTLPPRLAGPDADEALAAYLALPPLPNQVIPADVAERSTRLRVLLTLLPTSPHLDRLFAALALRLGFAEAKLRRLAFEVWTERDAPAAARWAAAIVPGEAINASARSRYVTLAASAWSRLDFDAAYSWASTLPDSGLARSASGALLGLLAATDPDRAVALARAGGEEFFAATQNAIFDAWSAKNPAAALIALGGPLLAENNTRWQVSEKLAKWAAGDPSAAFAWLETQSGLSADSLRSAIWSMASNIVRNEKSADLRPFADALTARTQVGQGQRQLTDFFNMWNRENPSAASAWLDSISDPAVRNQMIADVIEHYSYDRSELGLPLALRLPPGPLRDDAVSKTLTRWAEQDPDAALAWLREHDDPSLNSLTERVQGIMLGKLAAADPAAALARWQSLPADASRAAAVPGIAKAWGENDPSGALKWVVGQLPELPNIGPQDFEKLSPEAQQELQKKFMAFQGHFESLQGIVEKWSAADPESAINWAQSLSSPLLKEGILQGMFQNSGFYGNSEIPDRSVRAEKIAAISDPSIRERVLSMHLAEWLRSDVNAAREWIESHDAISPEKAAELLTRAGVSTP